MLLEVCNPWVQSGCVKCFSIRQWFALSKTFNSLEVLFWEYRLNIYNSASVNSNQIQVDLDLHLFYWVFVKSRQSAWAWVLGGDSKLSSLFLEGVTDIG